MSNDVKDGKLEFEVIGNPRKADKLRADKGYVEYEVGRVDTTLAIKITGNFKDNGDISSGTFWTKPLLISQISDCLKHQKPKGVSTFSSAAFDPLFTDGNNNNNRAFLAAILRNEGLIAKFSSGAHEHKLAVEVDDIEEHLRKKITF